MSVTIGLNGFAPFRCVGDVPFPIVSPSSDFANLKGPCYSQPIL